MRIPQLLLYILYSFMAVGAVFALAVDLNHSSVLILASDISGLGGIGLLFLLSLRKKLQPHISLGLCILLVMVLFIIGFVDAFDRMPQLREVSFLQAAVLTLIFGLICGFLLGTKALFFLGGFSTLFILLTGVMIQAHLQTTSIPLLTVISVGSFTVVWFYRKRMEQLMAEALQQRQEAENSLRQLEEAQEKITKQERLALLGSLVSGISHELRNPLNFINNFSEITSDMMQELEAHATECLYNADPARVAEVRELIQEISRNLKDIAIHGKRGTSIIHNMLLHNRPGQAIPTPVDFNEVVREAATLALQGYRAREHVYQLQLDLDLSPSLGSITMVEHEISRVVLNLCANGFYEVHHRMLENHQEDYIPTVRVCSYQEVDADQATWYVLQISDNGRGIQTLHPSQIFLPFFTTKPAGEGTGLGLSMAYEIVTVGHGGTMEVQNQNSGGAIFTIRLPRKGKTPGGELPGEPGSQQGNPLPKVRK